MKNKVISILMMLFVLLSNAAFAQDKEKKSKDEDPVQVLSDKMEKLQQELDDLRQGKVVIEDDKFEEEKKKKKEQKQKSKDEDPAQALSERLDELREEYLREKNLTFTTESGLGIQFGGEVEINYINVEGKGGFTYQDLTYQKVKNRSPHVVIRKAIFSTRVYYTDYFTYQIEFAFNDKKALVDKHYARLVLPKYRTLFELGKNRPMIAIKRRTGAYPLIGTAFWKGREYHLTSNTAVPIAENLNMNFGLSGAMKRALGTDDVAQDKSFKMIVYDDYDVKDGQTTEFGIQARLDFHGVYAQGWYYISELIDDFDWKIQLSQTLSGYDALGDKEDKTHYWYGGRVGFDFGGASARAEYINGQDGLLPRDGFYGEASYEFDVSNFLPLETVRPLVRYGELYVGGVDPVLGETESWDRQMTTLALLTDINSNIFLRIEYYFLDEVTGGSPPTEDKPADDTHVNDDQLVIQLEFRF